MQPRTHLAINRRLCGEPVDCDRTAAGVARVALTTVPEMAADEAGLVHGGFVFGLADHAAMLAVNHPNVVVGSAEVRFLAPVAVGERLVAEARREEAAGRKSRVSVEVRRAAGGAIPAAGVAGGESAASGESAAGGESAASGESAAGGESAADGERAAGGKSAERAEGAVAPGEVVLRGELICWTLDRHVLAPAGEA